ncbi:MAG: MFS transporter, partial [Muribaculaceae bacterium]|nr:MFS transporter [Muribaculaceae bacterium]
MNRLLNFFAVSEPSGARLSPEQTAARYRRLRWLVFLSATLGYGLCEGWRVRVNVINKPRV